MRNCSVTLIGAVLLSVAALCVSCATSSVATKPKPVSGAAEASTAKGDFGYLASSMQKFRLALTHAYTMSEVSGTSAAPAKLPVGSYSLEGWRLEQADASGTPWQIAGVSGQRVNIDIQANKTQTLTFGLPLKASLQWSRTGDVVSFAVVLAGQNGERYSPASIGCNGQRVEAPGVKIVDSGGRLISQGRFQYG